MELPEITVRLRLVGADLVRQYHHPVYKQYHQSSVPFTAAPLIEAMTAALSSGNQELLIAVLAEGRQVNAGEALFGLLFGPGDEELVLALARVYGRRDDHPITPLLGPIHVRVFVDDPSPVLHGLPWRAAAFRGRSLSLNHWRFTLATGIEAGPIRTLPLPARVLIVAPTPSGTQDLGTALHLASLGECLQRSSHHYREQRLLRVVRTRDELQRAADEETVDILYYYGHGEVRGDQSCLLLGGPADPADPVPLAWVRHAWRGRPPAVAYLNGCWTGGGGLSSAGHQLCPEVPVVIANRTTAWTEHMAHTAERWFHRVLIDEMDPLTASHEVAVESDLRKFEWVTRTVHASCRRMDVVPTLQTARVPAADALDRLMLRSRIWTDVHQMCTTGGQRVESLLVHASPDNLPQRFGRLLRNHLEELGTASIRTRYIELDDVRWEPFDGLQERLAQALRDRARDPEAPMGRALTELARPGDTPQPILLYLHWGTVTARRLDELLPIVREWASFGLDVLTRECPANVRVLSLLAIELPARHHAALRAAGSELADDVDTSEHALHYPTALSLVERDDLRTYLLRREQSGCNPDKVREATKELLRVTDGQYDELCKWLDDAWHGWTRVLRALRELPTRKTE